ncbi:MAG TPA: trehalose-phosphatase [Acidimicrobiales bacterium]|nr:trehalose-phosphatase [Acidimicrobiales bacterium]
MSPRPGPTSSPALAALAAEPGRSGIVCDFDGTLAPIVADPAAARPLAGAVEVLHRLAERYATVAVVSGRPMAFLVEHLALGSGSRLRVAGLYGLETWAGGSQVDRWEPWRRVVAEVADRADAQAPPGVLVERKGLTVTVHYRTAPEAAVWARVFAEAEAARTGLALHPARMSEELRPPVAVDKGTVVADLARDLAGACFLGDDLGDLPAFVALDELAATGLNAVKVAVASAEAPPDLIARADLVVDGPDGALALLTELLAG